LLGVLRPEHHADGDVVNPGLVPQDQALQRGTVAAAGLFDQFGVRGVAPGDLGKGVEHDSSPWPAGADILSEQDFESLGHPTTGDCDNSPWDSGGESWVPAHAKAPAGQANAEPG